MFDKNRTLCSWIKRLLLPGAAQSIDLHILRSCITTFRQAASDVVAKYFLENKINFHININIEIDVKIKNSIIRV